MNKRTRIYSQLLDESKKRRETNIEEHKQRTGHIKHSLRARRKLQEAKKETKVPKVPLDFLAIGDSWFEFIMKSYHFRTTRLSQNRNLAQWEARRHRF